MFSSLKSILSGFVAILGSIVYFYINTLKTKNKALKTENEAIKENNKVLKNKNELDELSAKNTIEMQNEIDKINIKHNIKKESLDNKIDNTKDGVEYEIKI